MKTGMIVCGFPGIGKTCVASELERYVDLESSGFNLTERDDEGRADAHHIWNLPENKPEFSAAANRTDASRGYPDPVSLCNAVLYWHDKKILKRHSLSISK